MLFTSLLQKQGVTVLQNRKCAMLCRCRCLREGGLHLNAQVYVFRNSRYENMRKSLHLSRSSGTHCLQSLLFSATSATLLILSFPDISIYKGFPRQKHVPVCQTLVLCPSNKENVLGKYHTLSSFSADSANTSWKHLLVEWWCTAQLQKP